MKITVLLSDDAILKELGERMAQIRLEKNLTQATLAEQAGVAKRTVERIESGKVATQFSGFLRVCRVLGILDRFEELIPAPSASPITQWKHQERKRRRASGRNPAAGATKKWTWGEPG
jgi:transcriptional regulator with XRE-family HTH domain